MRARSGRAVTRSGDVVRRPCVSSCLCGLVLLSVLARAGWFAELGIGTAFSLPSDLVIRQDGEEDIELVVRYDTRPFYEVPYHDLRVGRADRRGAGDDRSPDNQSFTDRGRRRNP